MSRANWFIYCLYPWLILSCAAFPRHKLEQAQSPTLLTPEIRPPSAITLVLHSLNDTQNFESPSINYGQIHSGETTPLSKPSSGWEMDEYALNIKKVFQKNANIQEVLISESQSAAKTDFVIEISAQESLLHEPKEKFWYMLSLGTLGIVPYWKKQYFRYLVRVIYRGQTLKTYHIEDATRLVVSIFVLPLMPFYFPKQQYQEVRRGIILHLLAQITRDRLWEQTAP